MPVLFGSRILSMAALILQGDAKPPDWKGDPQFDELSATIVGALVKSADGEQMGEESADMLAVFDRHGNCHGVGKMLRPPFGPHQDSPVFELSMMSNHEGDLLHFKYYHASTDTTWALQGPYATYKFKSNDNLGNMIDPITFTSNLRMHEPAEGSPIEVRSRAKSRKRIVRDESDTLMASRPSARDPSYIQPHPRRQQPLTQQRRVKEWMGGSREESQEVKIPYQGFSDGQQVGYPPMVVVFGLLAAAAIGCMSGNSEFRAKFINGGRGVLQNEAASIQVPGMSIGRSQKGDMEDLLSENGCEMHGMD